MSLLLDALKKAAEKKARKSGQATGDTDAAHSETTRVDDTEAMTRSERIEATDVDATLTATRRLDQTEITEDHARTERMEASGFEQTFVDTIRIDETEIDATQVDATEVNEDFVETERMEAADDDLTRPIGASEPQPQGHDETIRLDVTELEEAQGLEPQDRAEENGRHDPGSDPTLLVMDDSIPIDQQGNTLIQTDEYDAEELARLRAASQPDLTEDDVTAFMGDDAVSPHASGIDAIAATRTVEMRPLSVEDLDRTDSQLGADDTTLTNPEESSPQPLDDTTRRNRPPPPAASAARPDDDDQSTVINPESPAASVDIDRLTNEQTLGGMTSTTARGGYAPDNYDRTLIKLTDSDVSRIFPGIKPEPGAVMTPEYAKKVFMSKSSRHRGRHLKWMGGMALLLLMMVGLWALYDLGDKSDRIDNSLARLKRDPMPGVIQPPKEEKIDLFAPPADDDAKGVTLASAEPPATPPADTSPARPAAAARVTPALEKRGEAKVQTPPAQPVRKTRRAAATTTSRPAAATRVSHKPAASTTAKAESPPPRLKLSSSERIDDKDRLLNEAYQAYEQGDLDKARHGYAQVLKLDPDNRNALLGMAAIEVQDGDYNRAIELYQRLLLLNPMDSEAMASLLAVANIDPRNGETRIKEMLRVQPDAPYLHFILGNMYSRQQRWAEAQTAYFEALKRKPDDANAAYNLAVSLEHLGKPGIAVEYYRRALANRDRVLAIFNADQVAQRIEVLQP